MTCRHSNEPISRQSYRVDLEQSLTYDKRAEKRPQNTSNYWIISWPVHFLASKTTQQPSFHPGLEDRTPNFPHRPSPPSAIGRLARKSSARPQIPRRNPDPGSRSWNPEKKIRHIPHSFSRAFHCPLNLLHAPTTGPHTWPVLLRTSAVQYLQIRAVNFPIYLIPGYPHPPGPACQKSGNSMVGKGRYTHTYVYETGPKTGPIPRSTGRG